MAHHFVEGTALVTLLRTINTPVKLVHLTGKSGTATPAEARELARSGCWTGKISERGTVKYLREFPVRTPPADPTHWDGRASLRFATDLRSIPEAVKRREEAAR
jgi:hypothetical protein